MTAQPSPVSTLFDAARAEVYDEQFAALQPLKDTVHLLLRAWFARLPDDAHILVAGAGTGAEVRYLAPLYPRWRFTLVDPSAPMLEVARRNAAADGIVDRCSFHAAYVSDLDLMQHDAATSLFVSHFLTDAAARQAYFSDIAARLKPGARLFVTDHAADRESPAFSQLMDHWLDMTAVNGLDVVQQSGFRTAFGRDVAAHGPSDVEAMIEAAGFTPPVACFQATLMRGWTAVRR